MRKILLAALIAVFGLGGIAATTGCEVKRKKHKKYKKWKKKRHKRWKKEKRWKKRRKHKRKAERVHLKEFFGDKENTYLDYVPIKIGQTRSSAKHWFGKKGKRKFKCDDGKFSIKARYDADDKVKEIKVNFNIDKETIVSFAKKKWGEPKKKNAKRIKWVKDELKIIVKRKGGKTKLSIKKDKGAKDAMKPGKDAMKPGMLPAADDDDDDDDDD
jgi:hypothetical protein